MQNLVIVESPAKAHTIKSYLGTGYKVVASKGHVRDLPKSTLGIDVENGFEAHYINIRGKGDLISDLKKDAKTADRIFLATDPDREGEAISWHLAAALDIPEGKSKRITFNEITKTAVKEAIRKPRDIDMDLVNAQQARRIVDRIVGYKLSPFLWKTVRSGLSAGRVQSVATRIIVEREEEIRAFVPEEYWCVDAELETPKGKTFKAAYYGSADGKKIELRNGADAERVVKATEGNPFIVADVKKGKKTKNPAPPFTTSTMQQEASRKLNFQSQRTMRVAQELYEGVNLGPALGGSQGLITYMRTDSLRVADEARDVAKQYITEKFGREFYPSRPRIYKSRSNSQDAHEAIRPSNPALDPARVREFLSADQYKLYRLIWNRFIASQMASAELSTVQTDVTCADCLFRATGYTVTFAGFMTLYEESTDDENGEKSEKIPALDKGETLKTVAVVPTQHFTEPPARYTEATLIKFLEEKGIGRPSTYTPIITIILSRGYVERDGKSLKPTPLGEVITKIMREQFPDIVDYKFTASLEDKLDDVEHGAVPMQTVLGDFYADFEKELSAANSNVRKKDIEVPAVETDIICDKCGARMIVKEGRYGKFAACPNYPDCKNTKPLTPKKTEPKKPAIVEGEQLKCDKCGADMVLRSGRFGSFFACSRYPECKNTKQIAKSTGIKCPDCGSDVVIKYGKSRKMFYSCEKYPECKFSAWDIPTEEKCPRCGDMLLRKKGKGLLYCRNAECGYKAEDPKKEETK